jgi:hypothetical protein
MKTKKNKLINLLKLGISLFGISLLLFNCEKQNFETEVEATKSPFSQKFVTLSAIPKVKQFLPKKLKSIYQNKSAAFNEAVFFENNILEVIDTLNNTNYSIGFLLPKAPKGQFFNLIIGKNSYGELKTPFVLKYTCDEAQINNFAASNYNFSFFKGVVSRHKYTDYFEKEYFSKTTAGEECPTEFDSNGDPVPCEIENIEGTSSNSAGTDGDLGSTGPGTTGSGSIPSAGGSGSCSLLGALYVINCGGSNTNSLHLFGGCGGRDKLTADYYMVWNCALQKHSKVSVDCPPCATTNEGGIGINTVSIETMRATLKKVLTLSGTQLGWVNHVDNIPEVAAIYAFLQSSQIDGVYDTKAKNFANEAISFLKENPQYNFEQYENWFSTFNAELETNPTVVNPDDITFETPLTQQTLPTFSTFLTKFPKRGNSGNYSAMSTTDAYTLAGGSLLNSHINQRNQYNNACAIRASRGLLYSGIQIPVLKYNGSQRTQKGGDLKNYILDAVSFNTYMIAKFGETTTKLEGADANDPVKIAAFLNGKNGIYVIINNDGRSKSSGGAGYSGHCDVIINGMCISGANTNPQGGVKSIRIWELN